jgi:hypothetical protein
MVRRMEIKERKRDRKETAMNILQRRVLSIVGQVSNLLYPRFPIGRASNNSSIARILNAPQAGSAAIRQTGSLRYVEAVHLLRGE